MKYLKITLVTCIVISCASIGLINKDRVAGIYGSASENAHNEISLNRNSTFSLTMKNLEVRSHCYGNWKMRGRNTILLTCKDTSNSIVNQISSAYLGEDTFEIQVINANKIKLGKIILKRNQ